jgi:hypothetical protein
VKAVSVARKLSTIKEWRQEQTCFGFKEKNNRNKSGKPQKLFWFRVRLKMVFVSRKSIMIKERRKEQTCFGKEITGFKFTRA